MSIAVVGWMTWQEARRARALLAGLVLTSLFLGLYAWGVYAAAHEVGAGAGRANSVARENGIDLLQIIWGQVLSAGLYGIAGIGALLSIFIGAPAIARDVETGTIQLLASRPIPRWHIVVGKWMGGCALLGAYVALSGSATVVIVWWTVGYLPINPILVVVALVMQAVVLHSLTIALSSMIPTIGAGVVAVIVHGIVVVAGFGARIGIVLESETLKMTGMIASLVLPSDAVWQLAASEAQPANPLPALGINAPMGPFDAFGGPHPAIIAYAAMYVIAMVALASRNLTVRDL